VRVESSRSGLTNILAVDGVDITGILAAVGDPYMIQTTNEIEGQICE